MDREIIPNDNCWIFVIKTDSYAGNFEREIISYMTGLYDESGVGDKEAEMFEKECPNNYEFENLITAFPDGEGIWYSATIWGNKGTDVAIFLETRPTEKQLELMMVRAKKFAAMTNPYDEGGQTCITISGFELRDYRVSHTDTKVCSW